MSIETFQQQTRAWLEQHCPPSMRTPIPDGELVWGGSHIEFVNEDQQRWFEAMRDKGWFCPAWPKEYGGGGLSAEQVKVLENEMRRLGCRPPQINLGIWMLGPVLLEHGSEQQKQRFLTPMAQGKVRWCQGFSEPNAGSDLANIRTTAEDMGDHYLVNGSKIWTSYGDKSDMMYGVFRTDKSASKHAGISLLVLDMNSEGITVRPIDLIAGKSAFCEVFFDNVKVPKDHLIGEQNNGWTLAKQLLQHERMAMSKFGEFTLPTHFPLAPAINQYMDDAQVGKDNALVQQAVACMMEEEAFHLTSQRMKDEMIARQHNPGLMSIMKLVHTEQEKVKFELLLDLYGFNALGESGSPFSDNELLMTKGWLNSFTQTIAGGSSEIQLNVIAKRVLELPDSKQGGK
ncbi:acyl-CoA dehydrogenase family protein [Thalassotalea ponticola]|uniref:acyl-CoA dehydrogenase family protein n=1 Tax=Thalassotalea ponticola TaxID=1523392 RepID=UPI0025B3AF44|nr:acyl-CoA dehydrogenase family protein [Thalassotalea ponticola]MDN3653454.1 acyl-CoA dehydrogenase family protein [Thalassotalea ponticola]